MKKLNRMLGVAALLSCSFTAFAQQPAEDLYDMSLEDLMDISVVSASNEEEKLFDAPVTIHAISRDEISRSGVTSIPEALRLIPGVIVRETTNGNFDVHLRGFDNISRYTFGLSQTNNKTLVMINNRPVFNNNVGGTFWESIPVDLADIERIEVVEGPSAPLFGPNAVTGVINILTRSYQQDELLVSGQIVSSQPDNSIMGTLAMGGNLSDKVAIGFSANYQNRNRLDDQSYFIEQLGGGSVGSFIDFDKLREEYSLIDFQYLDPERSLYRAGFNGYVSVNPNEDFSLEFSSGYQANEAQKVFWQASTPLTFSESNSAYANLATRYKSFKSRISYTAGTDELHRTGRDYSSRYDFNVFDANLEYDKKLGDIVRIRPSIGLQKTVYNDSPYEGVATTKSGLIADNSEIQQSYASLRADFTPLEGLRIVTSGRYDLYDFKDINTFSYQGAITYSPIEKLLIRGVYGKSYSGLFFNAAFTDVQASFGFPAPNAEGGITIPRAVYFSNDDINLAHNTLAELGLRYQVTKTFQIDLSIFQQQLDNITELGLTGQNSLENIPNGDGMPSNNYFQYTYFTYYTQPYSATQKGLTLSANYLVNDKLQLKPFITVQKTEVDNFDYYFVSQLPVPLYQGETEDHKTTPSVVGGFVANYKASDRFNINLNGYYLGEQTHYHYENFHFNPGNPDMSYFAYKEVETPEQNIAGKLLLNTRLTYRVVDKLHFNATVRNILDDDSREYYATDRTKRQFLFGINYNF